MQWTLTTLSLSCVLAFGAADRKYVEDVEFLLDRIEQQAGALLKQKGVDWKAARREFTKEARKVKDPMEHLELCGRILARTRDGHAGITEVHFDVPQDDQAPGPKGIGLTLAIDGRRVLVRDCFGPAAAAGVRTGHEVVEIEDQPALKWLEQRADQLADRTGYSTRHAALYAACHWGLTDVPGTSFSFRIKPGKGGARSLTLTCKSGGGNGAPLGPLFPPADAKQIGRHSYGLLEPGIGWIHLREVEGELPRDLDQMLEELGALQGLVLDMRANGGGGCDHDAVFSRFLRPGETLGRRRGLEEGQHYTGPLVLIFDAGTRSAGETVAGMLKESGRAYAIAPTPTAGMSGSKDTVHLPSGLLTVRFVVRSYRANGGDGPEIEGYGVQPHEVVAFDPVAMEAGIDPHLARAVTLLKEGLPQEAVRYPE